MLMGVSYMVRIVKRFPMLIMITCATEEWRIMIMTYKQMSRRMFFIVLMMYMRKRHFRKPVVLFSLRLVTISLLKKDLIRLTKTVPTFCSDFVALVRSLIDDINKFFASAT